MKYLYTYKACPLALTCGTHSRKAGWEVFAHQVNPTQILAWKPLPYSELPSSLNKAAQKH